MGVWSQSIFGNDLACDARDAYLEQRSGGADIETAVRQVRRELAEPMHDADGKRTVWIALAAVQLKQGRVSDHVRESALKAIAWCEKPGRDPESFPFRLSALAALRRKLGGTRAPTGKSAPPPLPPGEKGDVIAIRFASNKPEAVVVIAGPAGNDRSPDFARVVLLFDLQVKDVTTESVQRALDDWRPYRQKWFNGLGRSIGLYDANGKLPPRKSRVIIRNVPLPKSFARRMRRVGAIYKSSELPHVINNDLSDWKSCEWVVDPADR